jgi:hypothetical protein
VQIFPPGGVGTIPTQGTEPTTTTGGGGDGDDAIAIIRAVFEQCLAGLMDEGGVPSDPAALSYTVVPGTVPDVFVVTVTDTEGGDSAMWSVNVATEDITPADPVAAETGQFCPGLA